MPPQVVGQSYGKSSVRLSRITREGTRHQCIELRISISLQGDFDAAYTRSDNRLIIPTDTMKNIVYVLAKREGVRALEPFALLVAGHFLEHYAHVRVVSVDIEQKPWRPLFVGDREHPNAFVGDGSERWQCKLMAQRGEMQMRSGISGLQILKTAGSRFRGFWKDDYTTLAETEERILATTVECDWPCRDHNLDWTEIRQRIRASLLEEFACGESDSVQQTMYGIATRVLDLCPEVDEVSLTFPNQHHLPVDLAPFGLKNENEVFSPTDEPYGLISATIQRE